MQKGFAPILLLVGIMVISLVVGGGIFLVQRTNKEPLSTKPGLHLQQISDPEKFVDPKQTNAIGQYCGGFAGKICPAGLTCKLDGDYPDASGKCVKE